MISPGDMIYWTSPILGLIGPGRVDSILDDYMIRVSHPIIGATVMIPRSWILDGAEKKPAEDVYGLL